MPTRYRRQFAAGSRPAPDPYDKFLDGEGFYRKHTARDSTCLFRVVSEQVFDTQSHHEQIRKDCVNHMIKHRDQYELEVQGDFDQYLREMAKTKTYGTLVELRALGYLFKRNILLFKPMVLGEWLIDEPDYKEPALRVFFAPERHFDSIFTKPFVTKAALCQCVYIFAHFILFYGKDSAVNYLSNYLSPFLAIVYEVLYKNVFKLPDIEYSVEMMLHTGSDDDLNESLFARAVYGNNDEYASEVVFDDGRKFDLDRPGIYKKNSFNCYLCVPNKLQ